MNVVPTSLHSALMHLKNTLFARKCRPSKPSRPHEDDFDATVPYNHRFRHIPGYLGSNTLTVFFHL